MTGEALPQRALAAPPELALAPVAPPTLAEVYEEHFRYVWRCLRSLGVRDGALDDAVQDVFLVVQQKIADFDGGCQLRTWLYAIVLRVARRHREREAIEARRFSPHEDSGVCPTAGPPGGDLRRDVERSERREIAQRALAELSEAKREVFVLACIERMTAPEIAEIGGLPLNTVYSRLRSARQDFADAVARLEADERSGA